MTETTMNQDSFPLKRRNLLVAGGALALVAHPLAQAQGAYPTRTVSTVVPFGPGNAYDMMVRYLADRLREATGQPFIVEAKQGALGGVAASHVARAAPDGYTLLMGANGTHAMNPALFENPGFDAEKDFEPIVLTALIPFAISVGPNSNVNSLGGNNPALPAARLTSIKASPISSFLSVLTCISTTNSAMCRLNAVSSKSPLVSLIWMTTSAASSARPPLTARRSLIKLCCIRGATRPTIPRSSNPMRPSSVRNTLPGCGSAWNKPSTSTCFR
jgi:hypothetical protein